MTCTHTSYIHTYITYIKHTFMCVCMSCMYVHSYTGEVYVCVHVQLSKCVAHEIINVLHVTHV